MTIDDLIGHYLDESRKPATRSLELEASLRSPEMLSSIANFSRALGKSRKAGRTRPNRSRAIGAGEDQTTADLSNLVKTAADFVTPGDLLKCIDLYDVGQVGPRP